MELSHKNLSFKKIKYFIDIIRHNFEERLLYILPVLYVGTFVGRKNNVSILKNNS